jgi:membrane protein DedA with SNARE-associated domain
MAIFSHADLQPLITNYGYWGIGLIVGLESMGIPLPGETILVLAAVYAAYSGDMSIYLIVAAATIGSIIGDNLGYGIGKRYGYPLLLKHGRKINMTEDRIKLGQYLFMNYGAKIVFLGRFIALLRILAAFLAGVNKMPWWSFMFANATGAILWASVFGFGGYAFGDLVFKVHKTWAPLLVAGAVIAFFGIGYLLHRNEKRWIILAKKALPGPLEGPGITKGPA